MRRLFSATGMPIGAGMAEALNMIKLNLKKVNLGRR